MTSATVGIDRPSSEPTETQGIGSELSWRDSTRLRTAGAATLMIGIVLLMVRPGLDSTRTRLPQNLGDPALVTWILSWQSHALVNDPARWFDGNMFGTHGSALGYSEIMLPLVPVFGVLRWMSGSAIVAMNLTFLLALTFAMFATYALGRHLGIGRVGSVLAATAFTFSSYTFAHSGHLQLLTFGFFPLGLLCLFRTLERQRARDGVLFGLASFGLVTGCLYYAVVWIPIVLGILLADLAVKRGTPGRDWWVAVATAVGSSAALLAPIGLLYLRFQQSVDFDRVFDPAFGTDASDFLAPAPGSYLYRTLAAAAWQRPAAHEHSNFPGIVILGFALVACLIALAHCRAYLAEARATRVHAVWLSMAVTGAVSLVLALGSNFAGLPMPFGVAFEHVPGFGSIRVPARLIVPLVLVISVAAVAALTWTIRRLGLRGTWLMPCVLVVVIIELAAPFPTVDALPDAADEALYQTLRSLPDGAVIQLPAASEADGVAGVFLEAERLLYSIGDWRLRFNGTSGGNPPGFTEEAAIANGFPDRASLQFFSDNEIRFVVVHTSPEPGAFTVSDEAADLAESKFADAVVYRSADAIIFDLSLLDAS